MTLTVCAAPRPFSSFQGLVGGMVGVAPKGYRQTAHLLYQFEGLHPIVLADDVAQNAPEQADVFKQRTFLVFALAVCGGFGGHADRSVIKGRRLGLRVHAGGRRPGR